MLYTNLTDPIGEITDENSILMYVPAMLMIIVFPLSKIIYKNYLKGNTENLNRLGSKLGVFQAAHLIRVSMFEATALLAAVICFITGTNGNLGILCIAITVQAFIAPTPFKIAEALNLSPEERNQLKE